jgi:hypothetical protein
MFINVVRLPRQSDASNTFVGKNVIATGYGITSNGTLTKVAIYNEIIIFF